MKYNVLSHVRKYIAVFAILTMASTAFAKEKEGREIQFTKFLDPILLDSLYLKVNGNVSITIGALFDDTGKVDDWVPIRTNDKKMVRSIENVIYDWRIIPPEDNGVPSWSYMEFEITLQSKGAVVTLTPMETVMTLFNTMKDDFYMVVPFSELDSIPTPIEMDSPKLPTKILHGNSQKTVKFLFFIDENGNVRMPLVQEAETETFATGVILESLMKWKFEPPKVNGQPVITRAIIPFHVK